MLRAGLSPQSDHDVMRAPPDCGRFVCTGLSLACTSSTQARVDVNLGLVVEAALAIAEAKDLACGPTWSPLFDSPAPLARALAHHRNSLPCAVVMLRLYRDCAVTVVL